MSRPVLRPSAIDLDSPGRRDYWVALEHDSLWGDHLLPLTVLVGPEARPSQGLVAFGSCHGNELEGPVAIRRLVRDLRIEDVRGRIILVPVLNPSAFRAGTRDTIAEDGVNLNRAFVDGAGKAPGIAGITHRIAAFVREAIWPRVHVVLDIHSGGGTKFAHVASFHPIDDAKQAATIEATARGFGTPFVMTYQNQTPGLLTSEAERLGKITVGTELGWGSAIDRDGVRQARQGILAAAVRHGQLRGTVDEQRRDAAQRLVSIVDRACYCVAPIAGHYEAAIDIGEPCRAGDTVGWLHDFDRIDEEPIAIRAAHDGVLLACAWANPVPRGQHVAVVAKVVG